MRVRAEEILFGAGPGPEHSRTRPGGIGVALKTAASSTNARMQTNLPHIYAAGDCTGKHEIVHIAIQQGEIAAHNAPTRTG